MSFRKDVLMSSCVCDLSVRLFREKMAQAYDFALDKVGMDVHSFTIWSDYVSFLKGV